MVKYFQWQQIIQVRYVLNLTFDPFFKKFILKGAMIVKKDKLLTFSSKKHLKFFLHSYKARDIKSIEKINVLEIT